MGHYLLYSNLYNIQRSYPNEVIKKLEVGFD